MVFMTMDNEFIDYEEMLEEGEIDEEAYWELIKQEYEEEHGRFN